MSEWKLFNLRGLKEQARFLALAYGASSLFAAVAWATGSQADAQNQALNAATPAGAPPAQADSLDQVQRPSSKPQRLEGRVTEDEGLSPLLSNCVQDIPTGTKVDLKVCGNLNSEISRKGDEVFAQVTTNVADGEHVIVPGGWVAHGHVTDVGSPKHNGRGRLCRSAIRQSD